MKKCLKCGHENSSFYKKCEMCYAYLETYNESKDCNKLSSYMITQFKKHKRIVSIVHCIGFLYVVLLVVFTYPLSYVTINFFDYAADRFDNDLFFIFMMILLFLLPVITMLCIFFRICRCPSCHAHSRNIMSCDFCPKCGIKLP
jgi:hypothetical protein